MRERLIKIDIFALEIHYLATSMQYQTPESHTANATPNGDGTPNETANTNANTSPGLNLLAPCPITQVLEIIAAKWTVEILREVAVTPTRTRKFLRVIPGLSMKSLQVRLKELEKYGLIERKEYDVLPRHVDHLITERGEKVLDIYMQIKSLADEMFHVNCICPMDRTRTTNGCSSDKNGCTSDTNGCTSDTNGCTSDTNGCTSDTKGCTSDTNGTPESTTESHGCSANTCPHRPQGRD